MFEIFRSSLRVCKNIDYNCVLLQGRYIFREGRIFEGRLKDENVSFVTQQDAIAVAWVGLEICNDKSVKSFDNVWEKQS